MSTATALINGETVELVLLGTEDEELAALDIPVVADNATSHPPTSHQQQQVQSPQLSKEGPTDSYGFYLESEDNDSCHKCLPQPPSVLKERSAKEKERLAKWLQMKRAWTSGGVQRKVKERSRKGIPDQMRDWAWYNMSAAKEVSQVYPSTAQVLTSAALRGISTTTMEDIERDIPRTFPRHKLFASGVGQQALRRVLQCYAVHDPIVGYCQGMGFIAGMLLVYMSEDRALHTFIAALSGPAQRGAHVTPFKLREMYLPSMAGAQRALYVYEQLGRRHLGALWRHLEAEGMHPTMYATEWLMTMFCRGFSFDLVTRVWDVFLHEDFKIVYRVALALVKNVQAELLATNFEGIMGVLRKLPELTDAAVVMEVAWALPIRRWEIQELEAEFAKSGGSV